MAREFVAKETAGTLFEVVIDISTLGGRVRAALFVYVPLLNQLEL